MLITALLLKASKLVRLQQDGQTHMWVHEMEIYTTRTNPRQPHTTGMNLEDKAERKKQTQEYLGCDGDGYQEQKLTEAVRTQDKNHTGARGAWRGTGTGEALVKLC